MAFIKPELRRLRVGWEEAGGPVNDNPSAVITPSLPFLSLPFLTPHLPPSPFSFICPPPSPSQHSTGVIDRSGLLSD